MKEKDIKLYLWNKARAWDCTWQRTEHQTNSEK